jgi:hypothetical protein
MSGREKTYEGERHCVNLESVSPRISTLLTKWEQLEMSLNELFEKRETQKAQPAMEEGVQIFIELLFITNEIPLKNDDILPEFRWQPINVSERVEFIKKRPDLYHSFIQLKELMVEQKKLWYKKMAIEKVTKQ